MARISGFFLLMDIEAIANSAALAAQWSQAQAEQLQRMRKVTEREKGLINIPQAAVLLDVSRERVRELMQLGTLSRFEFLDHIYLSFREVVERRAQDIKAGRPKRGMIQRIAKGIHAAALTDKLQAKQGGYAGPYVDKQMADKKAQRRVKKKSAK
jgi:hypothetical protein